MSLNEINDLIRSYDNLQSVHFYCPVYLFRENGHIMSTSRCFIYWLKTLVPNFQTSSTLSATPPLVWCSDIITKSASAPSSRQPFEPSIPNMAAGVEVTALSALGTSSPDQLRKLLTHSISVMELFTISVSTYSYCSSYCYRTYLPAILSEPSSNSKGPFFTMWLVQSPFVHEYAPSGSPTRCMASVTRMKPSGWAL
jgi:hypothetical protein